MYNFCDINNYLYINNCSYCIRKFNGTICQYFANIANKDNEIEYNKAEGEYYES